MGNKNDTKNEATDDEGELVVRKIKSVQDGNVQTKLRYEYGSKRKGESKIFVDFWSTYTEKKGHVKVGSIEDVEYGFGWYKRDILTNAAKEETEPEKAE